ncbi:MAG: RNP-1 like protein RNA-binding protein [Candidatus Woesebacteria bacterium GW2011_GWA1_37_7]|uniref:RNP-1 like protein RNA-binding protein n=1 Tax=Candidatus Woesebacteria bacterium GW2011_GWA1_37_7 TaxID=1618545 RepID=A0A0G0K6Z5_9BACT|nr:MAG: RNP-1 like protein RNA-binding protein [Candidatus Woesebacteria bacterium GW2011_GWA1_37_7]
MAKRLFVGGLPYSVTDAKLNEMFSVYGEVVSASVIVDRMLNRSKGFGFVEMKDDKDAEKATKGLNNTVLEERTIVVSEARPRPENTDRNFGSRRFDNDKRRSFGNNRRPQRGGRY